MEGERREERPPRPEGMEARKRMLKPAEQQLIDLLREVGYGTLSNVVIRSGEVQLTPRPRARRNFRLGRPELGRHARPMGEDFQLKAQQLELIERLRLIRNDVLVSIDVQDGLPLNLVVDEEVIV
ncbi:MAG: hypothetical protein SF069_03420 [Phycisphaerae bacterium]|nr:hypothetical protein [Phycisphaerae bacterium]